MKEIRIYNRDLELLGIIDNYTSLRWTRRFFECGSFEMTVPITKENMALLKHENIVHLRGANEAGIIEVVNYSQDETKRVIIVTGRFLTAYLDRRIIKGTYYADDQYVNNVMKDIVSLMTKIPKLEIGIVEKTDMKVTFQATYKNVLSRLEKLSACANMGFRIVPDFVNRKLIFETYLGKDKTREQSINNHVEFSDIYENLARIDYLKDSTLYKNVCYVGGKGEGEQRKIEVVGSAEGLDLYEMFLGATDIDDQKLTAEKYATALQERGTQKLAETKESESFELAVGSGSNFVYKEDYDLGDVVTVNAKDWNIRKNLRITEIAEYYEAPIESIELTFGTPVPAKIDWSNDNE